MKPTFVVQGRKTKFLVLYALVVFSLVALFVHYYYSGGEKTERKPTKHKSKKQYITTKESLPPPRILYPLNGSNRNQVLSYGDQMSKQFETLERKVKHTASLFLRSSYLNQKPQISTSVGPEMFHPQFSFTINVITYNRPKSLARLLHSLQTQYYGHKVTLEIYVEYGADQETIDIVSDFKWIHGPKRIHKRFVRGGLVTAVLESWYPAHDHDYVLLAEDDIELSEHWFLYVLRVLLKYRYAESMKDIDTSIYGISLYTPRLCENSIPRREFKPDSKTNDVVFLHQVPCSWGAVYFPQHWLYYRLYAEKRKEMNVNVHIPQCECNGWTGSWVKYYTELNYLKGWSMIYPNFPNQQSLSTNHMEIGVHIQAGDTTHKKEDFTVPLISDYSPIDDMILPDAANLLIIDYKCDASKDKRQITGIGSFSWRQFLHELYLVENPKIN